MAASLSEWKAKNPTLPNTPTAAPTRPIISATPETDTEEKNAKPPAPEIPKIPHGDLGISPALNHYTQLTGYIGHFKCW